MTKEALKIALEWYDSGNEDRNEYQIMIESILAQPEQEPVAWWSAKLGVFDEKHFDQLQPLYTTPPKREWVGLTDEEMQALWDRYAHMEMMRAIEAKLKEKNT